MQIEHPTQTILLVLAIWFLVAAYFGIKLGTFMHEDARLFSFAITRHFVSQRKRLFGFAVPRRFRRA